ncbi:hypothetical protein ACSBOB_11560 [Mesorhizobium sp. ASY16-5R]|uniref:hypothetical protein n=1 Tax=Mesorhizobium sp. ASY16-5R TaxID=3445772 RepID=UPI003F9ED2B3
MPFTRYFGVFNPAELATIQKVFDRLCEERMLSEKDRDQCEELAAEVIHVFQQGKTAEAALLQSLSSRQEARESDSYALSAGPDLKDASLSDER